MWTESGTEQLLKENGINTTDSNNSNRYNVLSGVRENDWDSWYS